ncbi:MULTISPECIES: bifunctional phosphoribosyl-AMP cyclohydrolase/phosphoribosyl-ATP diphosphatase HisIE [unclassified Clostridioides]|uniref:bifunctional phosphoribosyl-AMP cyclohydrolase/phosphoribosyl-ATP diphosphatase HisIE n=1 Tax=unclassified Clostridioides TaxID=2635829 RepID=UPI001D108123|nr:bifunctional phosphoribosyl-AMP cyclohydrolase/phosphoribosyl-ATP diphosphatase HisIE [Clostridioides sp. ES-S-0190-01]UDN63348.1 bifunctional phosphoribosyl-AMP cyclohydrolase/phosphoribosyl-ATP diphosphatase HisIE [Clostridioides sp. ES-W-0016-02]
MNDKCNNVCSEKFEEFIKNVKFDDKGLVPAVVQDIISKDVLMLAYMNEESIKKTLKDKIACYFSRSRQELWVKGETSGNIQKVVKISYDCDVDTILLLVEQTGVACHTGNYSCFYRDLFDDTDKIDFEVQKNTLKELYDLINERKNNPIEGSYTNYLFDKGLDKILKKVGEESSEVIIASKNEDKSELIYEISDLVYHTLVLMIEKGVEIDEIKKELIKRRK